jgi:hypothetical protein
MITADQLVCHAIGDYVLQSDWMANTKTKRSVACLAHVATYALPFLFLRPSRLRAGGPGGGGRSGTRSDRRQRRRVRPRSAPTVCIAAADLGGQRGF